MLSFFLTYLYGCVHTGADNSKIDSSEESIAESDSTYDTFISQQPSATSSANPTEIIDFLNENVHLPEGTILVNELDNNEKALIYLGMTRNEVSAILKENGIYYSGMESDTGNCVFYFYLSSGEFFIQFNEENETIDAIQVSEDTPTQLGLKIGDTFDSMVALYGEGYKRFQLENSDIDEKYDVFEYKIGDHYFQVWFQSDTVAVWQICRNSWYNG